MSIQTIKFHKRSTGKTGQVLASAEVEYKLARVERLFKVYHGVPLGRYKLYNLALEHARESKEDVGGYLQYTTQAIVGVILDKMHKELSANIRKKEKELSVEIGTLQIDNLRELARQGRGKAKKSA
jgi:hypothetical protein|tara:strand:- start:248 stop:625 length:378 start_codon:yes stop_codon:yes gene_type:complete